MEHHFNVELAEHIGVEKSIIMYNILHWLLKNKENNKHIYDNKVWTYNSYSAFEKLFPYMKLNTIKRCIRELEQDKFLVSRNDLNNNPYDKTKWYSIGDNPLLLKSLSIVKKITIDDKKNNHHYNDTDNKPDNKLYLYKQQQKYFSLDNLKDKINLLDALKKELSKDDFDEFIKHIEKEEEKSKQQKKESLVLFENSKWYNDRKLLMQHFLDMKPETRKQFADAYLPYYVEIVKDWSDSANKKRTNRGWLGTIKNFIRNDKKQDKLMTETLYEIKFSKKIDRSNSNLL